MSNPQVAMPGDADEPAEKIVEQRKSTRGKRSDSSSTDAAKHSDTTDEAKDVTKREGLSPAQHDDDGWGDVPVQMRGE